MLNFMQKHWWKLTIVLLLIILLPIFIERVLFGLGDYIPLTTAFSPDQILNYFIAVMALLSTIILGLIVWKQNQAIHTMNNKLQQKNTELAEQANKQNEVLNEINIALQKQNIEIAEKNMLYATYNYSSIKYVEISISDENAILFNKEAGAVNTFNSADEIHGILEKLGISIKDIPLQIYTKSAAELVKIDSVLNKASEKTYFNLCFSAKSFRDIPISKMIFNGLAVWINGIAKYSVNVASESDLFINNNFKAMGTTDANHSFDIPLKTDKEIYDELIFDVYNNNATLVMGLTYINMFSVNFNCTQSFKICVQKNDENAEIINKFAVESEHISVHWLEVRDKK